MNLLIKEWRKVKRDLRAELETQGEGRKRDIGNRYKRQITRYIREKIGLNIMNTSMHIWICAG